MSTVCKNVCTGCVHVCLHVHAHEYECVSIVHACACMLNTYVCVCMYMRCMCMCAVSVCSCTCVCVHVYVCIGQRSTSGCKNERDFMETVNLFCWRLSLVSNTLAAFSEGLVLAKFPHEAGKKPSKYTSL